MLDFPSIQTNQGVQGGPLLVANGIITPIVGLQSHLPIYNTIYRGPITPLRTSFWALLVMFSLCVFIAKNPGLAWFLSICQMIFVVFFGTQVFNTLPRLEKPSFEKIGWKMILQVSTWANYMFFLNLNQPLVLQNPPVIPNVRIGMKGPPNKAFHIMTCGSFDTDPHAGYDWKTRVLGPVCWDFTTKNPTFFGGDE